MSSAELAAPSTDSATLDRLDSFVSPYTGIVRAAVGFLRAPHESAQESVGCSLADGEDVVGFALPRYTAGSHWEPGAARAAAIGEALERYSVAAFRPDNVLVGAARDLGPTAVAPSRFALFHELQHEHDEFRFTPFRDDTRLRWVPAYTLPGGEPALLPYQLVSMQPPPQDEPVIAIPTSSGVACADSPDCAVLAGLLEVIERDCFMLAWYNRLSLPRLDWSGDPVLTELDHRYFARTGLDYALVDASVFFDVPVLLGVVRGDGALGVGAGSAPSVGAAWRKALSEAFSVHRWLQDKLLEEPQRRPRARAEIRDFDDHVLFYADAERQRRTEFLDASTATSDVRTHRGLAGSDAPALIENLCARLAGRGASAYVVDVTAPEVRKAGFAVARVVSPELCSLDVLGWAPHLGGRRILHAAHEAGLVPAPLAFHELNPDPHPFP